MIHKIVNYFYSDKYTVSSLYYVSLSINPAIKIPAAKKKIFISPLLVKTERASKGVIMIVAAIIMPIIP